MKTRTSISLFVKPHGRAAQRGRLAAQLLLLVLISMILFPSCQKNDPGKSNDAVPLIKTITDAETGYSYLALHTYDAQKRVTKIDDNGTIVDFNYSAGKITETRNPGNSNISVWESELNEKGLVKSRRKAGEAAQSFNEYNAEGFITGSNDNRTPQFRSTWHYNAQTGLVDSIRYTLGGAWSGTHVYSYYTDKANTIGSANEGKPYYGKDLPHPIKRQEHRYIENNAVKTTVYEYTYTFDSIGRIHSRSYTDAGQPRISFYTYYD